MSSSPLQSPASLLKQPDGLFDPVVRAMQLRLQQKRVGARAVLVYMLAKFHRIRVSVADGLERPGSLVRRPQAVFAQWLPER